MFVGPAGTATASVNPRPDHAPMLAICAPPEPAVTFTRDIGAARNALYFEFRGYTVNTVQLHVNDAGALALWGFLEVG